MNAIILYDATGRVYSILYGEDNPPKGIPYVIIAAEEAARVSHIDVSDQSNHVPVLRGGEAVFDVKEVIREQQSQIDDITVILADVLGGVYGVE